MVCVRSVQLLQQGECDLIRPVQAMQEEVAQTARLAAEARGRMDDFLRNREERRQIRRLEGGLRGRGSGNAEGGRGGSGSGRVDSTGRDEVGGGGSAERHGRFSESASGDARSAVAGGPMSGGGESRGDGVSHNGGEAAGGSGTASRAAAGAQQAMGGVEMRREERLEGLEAAVGPPV